jgi:CBS domain-containing protein
VAKLIDCNHLILKNNSSIKEAMELLDSSAMQIALLTDSNNRLVGTLTDGDIRRSLLKGYKLSDPASVALNYNPKVGYSYEGEEVWQLKMKESNLINLPIVNDNRHLLSLFTSKVRFVGKFDNPVVLMLGGLGTRLKPLTDTMPKPMLNIGDKPILAIILEQFISQGFSNFYFCINYLGDIIKSYFKDGSDWGVSIEYIEEKSRMGTAGALSLISFRSKSPLIVMNGDLPPLWIRLLK